MIDPSLEHVMILQLSKRVDELEKKAKTQAEKITRPDKNMKKPKLTAMERRAAEFCADASRFDSTVINVEWRKSSTWGLCPVIEHNGAKVAYASGCGYCKLSAVLAETLRFLFEPGSEAFCAVQNCHGAGVGSVESALVAHGWKLETTASGKTFDSYRLTRAAA